MKITYRVKTIPEQIVPAHTITETVYDCEECGYQSSSRIDCEDHFLKRHLPTIYTTGYKLFWFDSKDIAQYWINNFSCRESSPINYERGHQFYVDWEGAGWYCMEGDFNLISINKQIGFLKDMISNAQEQIKEINKAIEEKEKMKGF